MRNFIILFIVFFLSLLVAEAFCQDIYDARQLLYEDKHEEALTILNKLDPEKDIEVLFYLGVANRGILNYETALSQLSTFYEKATTDDKERLRVAAYLNIIELLSIKRGSMSDVHETMKYSNRKLSIGDTGEQTQLEQKRIIDMLNSMIHEEEKSEASSSTKNTKKQNSPPPPPSKKFGPDKERIQGKSESGGDSNVANGRAKIKHYDGPISPWDRLRDRSRDPANHAIKEKLPAKYQNLIDKYYERAGSEK